MRSEQSSAVKAGIFVLVCGVLVIVSIVLLGQRSQLFAREYRLWSTFRNASGLIPGAAVRVAGVNAGSVRSVEIVSEPGKAGEVKVVLDVASRYHDKVRQDSRSSIRTLGPLGDKYVEISIGSPETPELKPGDNLASEETVDFYEIAEQARKAIDRANAIAQEIVTTLTSVNKTAMVADLQTSIQSLNKILEGAQKGPGVVHSVLFDPELPKALDDLKTAAADLRASAENVRAGKGPLGALIFSEKLSRAMDDLADTSASVKAVLREIEKGEGAAHSLVYDPKDRKALADLGEAAGRLNGILKDVQEGRGTLGLLIADPAVWESLKRLLGGAEESWTLKYLIRQSAPEKQPPMK